MILGGGARQLLIERGQDGRVEQRFGRRRRRRLAGERNGARERGDERGHGMAHKASILTRIHDSAHAQSDPRVLGRLGRMGARRDGFVHLRARARAGAHRAAAAIGDSRDARQRRLLRQRAVRAVPRRLGPVDDLGTARRPLRPRPHAEPHDRLLLGVHAAVRRGGHGLAARDLPGDRRHRHRRRVVDGRDVHRRGVARGPPADGRRLHAHRLLLRLLPRRDRQLLHRREVRLARDVPRRRHAGAPRRLHPLRRARIGGVEGAHRRGAPPADAGAGVHGAVLAAVRAADDPELDLPARVDRRAVGGIGLRAGVGDADRDARRLRRGRRRAARVVRHDAAVGRHDCRLPRAAAARRAARPAADARRSISS